MAKKRSRKKLQLTTTHKISILALLVLINIVAIIAYMNSTPEVFREVEGDLCYADDGKLHVRVYYGPYCPHTKWVLPELHAYMSDLASSGDADVRLWEYNSSAGPKPTKEILEGLSGPDSMVVIGEWDDKLTPEYELVIPEEEFALYRKANPIVTTPTIVVGCKYVKIGNIYELEDDIEAEIHVIDKKIRSLLK